MSKDTIPVVQCDRCSLRVELREVGQEHGWGQAWATAPHPDPDKPLPRQIGGPAMQADICPSCADELFAWWISPPSDRASPPPVHPVARLTRKQRLLLQARIETDLKDQVTQSIGVVKEQPSSILSEDIVPGAFDGIDIRAKRLVKDLLRGMN